MRKLWVQLRGGAAAEKLANEIMCGEWITHNSPHLHFQRGGTVCTNTLNSIEIDELLAAISIADFPLRLLCSGRRLESCPSPDPPFQVVYVTPVDLKWENIRKRVECRRMSYDQAKAFLEDRS